MKKNPVKLPSSPLRDKAALEELMGGHDAQDTQDTQAVQDVQDTQEVHNVPYVQDVHDTQVPIRQRKQKHPRINMAFDDENLDYLRLVSRMDDVSITAYVNNLIATDRAARAHDVLKARRVLK